jgi:DNA-binding CsgD family transcriptional regulator
MFGVIDGGLAGVPGDGHVRDTLLDREFEVRALERALDELALGRGGVVFVESAVGLGKTALLQRAGDLALEAGYALLSARGAELERDFTLGVVRQLFEFAVPGHSEDGERLFAAAAATAGLPDDGRHQASSSVYHLLNGLYWLLVNLAAKVPVVMLVDDAQWADSLSLRFLGFLARRMDSVAVAVIVASGSGSRDGGALLDDLVTAGTTTVLEPKGLSRFAVAELVRRSLGRDADEEFCVACHTVTGGNPLFVRELLRVLAANDTYPDATAVASVWEAGPDAVRRPVMARLRRQRQDVRCVARAVAVLGDDTDLALVARQAGLTPPSAAAAAGELVHGGIFGRVSPPAFVHGAVRDVVLSAIPAAELPAAHERAAAILQEAGEPADRIASHLLGTTPDGHHERVSVLLAAAHQASKQGSPGRAAVYLRRARSEPPPAEMRCEVSRLLGACEAQQLALAEAEVHLREAFSLADSPLQWAMCAAGLARVRAARGAPGEAVDLLAQAIADLPAEQNALATELRAELIGFARSDLSRRRELLDHLADYRPRRDRPDVITDAQQSVEAAFSGAPASYVAGLARRALVGDQLLSDKPAIWAAVHMLIVTDELDEAERRLTVALDAAVRRGQLSPAALVRGYLARVSWLRGDLPRAWEHVELGCRGLPAPNVALPALQATQIELLVEDGRLDEAAAVAQHAMPPGHAELDHIWQLWLLGARARLYAAQDRADDALADAVTCGRLYQQWGGAALLDVPWRLTAAEAHRRLGDPDRAAALVAEHLELARSFGVARHVAAALAASGNRPAHPHPTGVRAFTPAERHVAQLAADGLTNRQIAERLFLSEKTVEAHLSRAYRKLGVRSRTQLAVRMAAAAGAA